VRETRCAHGGRRLAYARPVRRGGSARPQGAAPPERTHEHTPEHTPEKKRRQATPEHQDPSPTAPGPAPQAGRGFFDYSDPKAKKKPINKDALAILKEFRDPAKDASQLSKEQLVERMMMRFIVEALYCLQDGVIRNARDGDVAAVMGIGFPPFRGGPFMYIDKLGADHVVSRLKALEAEHGAQYAPPEILLKHAKDGTPFISSAPEPEA